MWVNLQVGCRPVHITAKASGNRVCLPKPTYNGEERGFGTVGGYILRGWTAGPEVNRKSLGGWYLFYSLWFSRRSCYD